MDRCLDNWHECTIIFMKPHFFFLQFNSSTRKSFLVSLHCMPPQRLLQVQAKDVMYASYEHIGCIWNFGCSCYGKKNSRRQSPACDTAQTPFILCISDHRWWLQPGSMLKHGNNLVDQWCRTPDSSATPSHNFFSRVTALTPYSELWNAVYVFDFDTPKDIDKGLHNP
jgi:hypothetical protein